MDEHLKPVERLRKKEDIRNVLQHRGYRGKYATYHFSPNPFSNARLGLIISRKVGNAVVRNRVKRLYREAFRRTKNNLIRQVDIVIRAKPSACDVSYQQVIDEYQHFIKEKQLLQDGSES